MKRGRAIAMVVSVTPKGSCGKTPNSIAVKIHTQHRNEFMEAAQRQRFFLFFAAPENLFLRKRQRKAIPKIVAKPTSNIRKRKNRVNPVSGGSKQRKIKTLTAKTKIRKQRSI